MVPGAASAAARLVPGVDAARSADPDATFSKEAREAAKCGMTCCANSSWVLIVFQCSTPPGLTVIATSVRPAHNSRTASIRSMTSFGVPTQTTSFAIISS